MSEAPYLSKKQRDAFIEVMLPGLLKRAGIEASVTEDTTHIHFHITRPLSDDDALLAHLAHAKQGA